MSLGFQAILVLVILVGPLPGSPATVNRQTFNESEILSNQTTESKTENEDVRRATTASSARMTKPKLKFPTFAGTTTRPGTQATATKSEKERDDEYVANAFILNRASTPMQRSSVKILDQPKTLSNTSAFNFIKLNVFMGATYMRTQTDAHKAEILGYINSVRRSLGVANLNFMVTSYLTFDLFE